MEEMICRRATPVLQIDDAIVVFTDRVCFQWRHWGGGGPPRVTLTVAAPSDTHPSDATVCFTTANIQRERAFKH